MKYLLSLIIGISFFAITERAAAAPSCPSAFDVAKSLAGSAVAGNGLLDYRKLNPTDELPGLPGFFAIDSENSGTYTATFLRNFQKNNLAAHEFFEKSDVPSNVLTKYQGKYEQLCYYTGKSGIQKVFFVLASGPIEAAPTRPSHLPRVLQPM